MAILAGLLGMLLVVYGLGYALFRSFPMLRFLTPGVFVYIMAVIALLLCYELAIRNLLGGWLRRGKGVPGALRYLNALVETSVPSILIVLVSREIDPLYVLQSPLAMLYAVFIVLSTLRLDFRLCAFTGLVAAAEYVALSFTYIGGGSGVLGGAARAARARRSRRRRSTQPRQRSCCSRGSPRASLPTSCSAGSATSSAHGRSGSASSARSASRYRRPSSRRCSGPARRSPASARSCA
jgi:hypothetical protein